MKKTVKKLISLVLVLCILSTCFIFVVGAINDTTNTWTFTYTGSNAKLDSTIVVTRDNLFLPNTVQYKLSGRTFTCTVTDLNMLFFEQSKSAARYATYVRLPAYLTTIQQSTFNSYVNYVKTIEIPGTATTSNDYFKGCSSLVEFIVNENNTNLKAIDGVLYKGTDLQRFPSAKRLDDTTVFNVPDGVKSLTYYAFYSSRYVTDVKIPASVETIKAGAFCNSNITGVHLENGSTYDPSKYVCYCSYDYENPCVNRLNWCLEDEQEGIAASCAAPGHTAGLRCDITGEWLSGEEIPQLSHSFTNYVYDNNKTCSELGTLTAVCNNGCGTEDVIPATDEGYASHKYAYRNDNEVEATCTADGSYDKVKYCENCEKVFDTETVTVPSNGHNYEITEYTAATCTEASSGVKVCGVCGDEQSFTDSAALGHSFTNYVYNDNRTCTQYGTKTARCDREGCDAEDTIVAVDYGFESHDVYEKVENEISGTCIKDGSYDVVEYCNVCKRELSRKTVTVSAPGHSYETTEHYEATCTKAASGVMVCGVCGDVRNFTDGAALGHSFTNYKYNNDATCTNYGTKTAHCDRENCELTDTVVAKDKGLLSHKKSSAVTENKKNATCTADGSYDTVTYCTVCNGELSRKTVVIKATGHADENTDYVCDNCGEKLRSPADDCTHLCHKDGFLGIIWKIARFFMKLFRINPVCECGVAHY